MFMVEHISLLSSYFFMFLGKGNKGKFSEYDGTFITNSWWNTDSFATQWYKTEKFNLYQFVNRKIRRKIGNSFSIDSFTITLLLYLSNTSTTWPLVQIINTCTINNRYLQFYISVTSNELRISNSIIFCHQMLHSIYLSLFSLLHGGEHVINI